METSRVSEKAHWLNERRLTVYPRLFLLVWGIGACVWASRSSAMVDASGTVLGDFLTFYAGAKMAVAGHAAWAYDIPHMLAAERAVIPGAELTAWFYPPFFFFSVLPLAAMPFFVAYAAFAGFTLAIYVRVLRAVAKGRLAMWCLAGFPGLWINLLHGQNAFLTASLASGGCLLLAKSPLLAGVLIGCLLATKPHLALLFPLLLVGLREWRALASASVTALALTGTAVAVFGTATIKPFLAGLAFARQSTENGSLPWHKMPTTFAMLRIWHVPLAPAYAAQFALAFAGALGVYTVWRKSGDWQLRGAALMTGTFLLSPYVFDYDLAWLAFPIAWMTVIGLRDGWLPWEREILVAAWLLPLMMAFLTEVVLLQPGPLILAPLLWNAVRRAKLTSGEDRVPAPEPALPELAFT